MLAVLVGGQQVEVSADSRLERMIIRASVLVAVLAAAIPVALAVFYPAAGPDSARNLTTVYAFGLGLLSGYIAGIMVMSKDSERNKKFFVVGCLVPLSAGLVSALVVAGFMITPFIAGAVLFSFPFGAITGKIFKL